MITRLALASFVALAMASAGCRGGAGNLPLMVVGPMRGGASLETFERPVQSVRAQGYDPLGVDPRFGSFAVRARATEDDVFFDVQCFGDGRVQVRVAGVDRSSRSGIAIVPVALRAEALRFVEALESGGGAVR